MAKLRHTRKNVIMRIKGLRRLNGSNAFVNLWIDLSSRGMNERSCNEFMELFQLFTFAVRGRGYDLILCLAAVRAWKQGLGTHQQSTGLEQNPIFMGVHDCSSPCFGED